MSLVTTFNKDCLPEMRLMPDKAFDLAIVDPPYGIDGNSHRNNKSRGKLAKSKDYDPELWSQEVPEQEYFDQLFRVSKHQIIWGINYFVGQRDLKIGGGRIVWDKCNGETSYSDAEIAYCSKIESVRLFRFMWNGMMQGQSATNGSVMQGKKSLNEKRIHPTQKPKALYRWTLNRFAEKGDTILDTHLGSGTVVRACIDLGFDITAFEKHPKYYADCMDELAVYYPDKVPVPAAKKKQIHPVQFSLTF